ncbi:DUF2341 domain-containing protein [bacterium]|nr:DUF2341 domain-containing protein [bacterium]
MYNSKKSFTLIELLIVIAIIGILFGILIISMTGAINSANDAKRKADIHQLVQAFLIHDTSTGGYPIDSCSIGLDCSEEVNNTIGSLVNSKDPQGGYYSYVSSDGVNFVVSAIMSDSNIYSYKSITNKYSSAGDAMSGWTKKMPVNINNTSGSALTEYQVRVTIPYSSLKSDCGDLRFTANNQETQLPYWIETCSSPNAQAWVKLPLIPDGNNNELIYAFYGNASASTTSNGNDTFLLFDDFSTNTVGTKWTERYCGTPVNGWMQVHGIENGGYHASQPSASDRGAGLISQNEIPFATVSSVKMSYTSRAGRTPPWMHFYFGYDNYYVTYGYWGGVMNGFNPNSPSDALISEWTDGSATDNIKFYRNGSLVFTGSANLATVRKPAICLRTASAETIDLYYDNFYSRKYSTTEPTITNGNEINN